MAYWFPSSIPSSIIFEDCFLLFDDVRAPADLCTKFKQRSGNLVLKNQVKLGIHLQRHANTVFIFIAWRQINFFSVFLEHVGSEHPNYLHLFPLSTLFLSDLFYSKCRFNSAPGMDDNETVYSIHLDTFKLGLWYKL